MTVEQYPGPASYTITGIGPYAIPHAYTSGAIAPTIETDNGIIELDPSGFSVTPDSGDAGDLTLSTTVAETYDGEHLVIGRDTALEQGWAGLAGAREKGLERQNDREVMGLQELRHQQGYNLRVTNRSGPMNAIDAPLDTRAGALVGFSPDGTQVQLVPAGAPSVRAGRVLIYSPDGTELEAGPVGEDIENAQEYADRAEAAWEAFYTVTTEHDYGFIAEDITASADFGQINEEPV